VIEEVCQVGTHGFAIDEQLNMNFIRDVAMKYKKGFGGNLKLTLALSLGLLSPNFCPRLRYSLRCSGGTSDAGL
ncbi:MAG: hypothetical protein JRF32_03865, partial [Deltaproteobacteria bacterium]|nr:hypothetical protein [Deltaproteobacteria bacterium]